MTSRIFRPPKILSGYFLNVSAKTDRILGTARGERCEPGPVFIPPRIMLQQMPPSRYPEALDQFSLRFRQPGELFKRLIEDVHIHLKDSALARLLSFSRASQCLNMELKLDLVLVIVGFQVKGDIPRRFR